MHFLLFHAAPASFSETPDSLKQSYVVFVCMRQHVVLVQSAALLNCGLRARNTWKMRKINKMEVVLNKVKDLFHRIDHGLRVIQRKRELVVVLGTLSISIFFSSLIYLFILDVTA